MTETGDLPSVGSPTRISLRHATPGPLSASRWLLGALIVVPVAICASIVFTRLVGATPPVPTLRPAGWASGAPHIARAAAEPTLDYATYIGGSHRFGDFANDVAVDAHGNAYIVGSSASDDLPIVDGWQATNRGGFDVFIAALGPDGTLRWSTYLGGTGDDYGHAVAVDPNGDILVVGETQSGDFPVVAALQADPGGIACIATRELCGDAFIARFAAGGGSILSSTYLGGRAGDMATAVSIDTGGDRSVVIAGATTSRDFPTTRDATQSSLSGRADAFVTVMQGTADELVFSTFFGGGSDDRATGLAFSRNGAVELAGWTESADLPVVVAWQSEYGGDTDAFVASLHLQAPDVRRASYLGGSGTDRALGIAVDDAGRAAVVGTTDSDDLPVRSALQPQPAGGSDAFLHTFDVATGEVSHATYLGGGSDDMATGVAIDVGGAPYVVGVTESADFPTTDALQPDHADPESADAFITRFASDGSRHLFSSFFGGTEADGAQSVALAADGHAHVVGYTRSEDLPTRRAAQAQHGGGNFDGFAIGMPGGAGAIATPPGSEPTPTSGPSPTPSATSTACAGEPPAVDPLTSPTDRTTQRVTGTARRLTDAGGEHTVRLCSAAGCFYARTLEGNRWVTEVAVLPNRVNQFTARQSSQQCSYVASTRFDRTGQPLDIVHRPIDEPLIYLPLGLNALE